MSDLAGLQAALAFKRQADPQGLLNPGKMIGWDNPDYAGMSRQSYLYKSLAT